MNRVELIPEYINISFCYIFIYATKYNFNLL